MKPAGKADPVSKLALERNVLEPIGPDNKGKDRVLFGREETISEWQEEPDKRQHFSFQR